MSEASVTADARRPPRRIIGTKYELIEQIGQGGMGSVWRAVHLSLGTQLAIKFLHGKVSVDDESRARFEREAVFAAKLSEQCVNITRVVDVGVDDQDVPYIVMEMLHGEDLERRLARDGALEVDVVRDVALQLCRALVAAHDDGVVHRDLKPANVFLCKRTDPGLVVKLLDFGVAKASNSRGLTTTKGILIGTPQYMSPEQLQASADVDFRADLWAVGAIVYRMLLGREAFTGERIDELAMRVMLSPHVAPSALDPRFGPELDAFMAKALAKKPSERFQSGRQLAVALEHALDAQRISSSACAVPLREDASASGIDVLPIRRLGRGAALTASATGLVVVGAVVALALRGGAAQSAEPRAGSPTTTATTATIATAAATTATPTATDLPRNTLAVAPASAPAPLRASTPDPASSTLAPPTASHVAPRSLPSSIPARRAPGVNLDGRSSSSWKDGKQM